MGSQIEQSSCYIAGRMRGVDEYNYPAFDAARDWLTRNGWVAYSPADLDREAGLDITKDLTDEDLAACFRRDFAVLAKVGAIVMLPGWELSEGATLERTVAQAMGLQVYYLDIEDDYLEEVGIRTRWVPPQENILQEAERLVYGARQRDYGHPRTDFGRTAQMMSAILGTPVRADQVPLLMIAVKISRLCERYKRDSVVDLAGYAGTLALVMEE